MRLQQYLNGEIELTDEEIVEELDEVFNSNSLKKVKINKRNFIDEYQFFIDNKEYRVRIMKYEESGIYDIMFFLKDGNKEITSITNTGNSTIVIGNVISAIEQFVNEYKPKIFQFEAYGNKRIRMYDIIIKRYLPSSIKKYKLLTSWKENLPIKIYRFEK